VVDTVQARGKAWISKVQLSHHGWALRACITSYHTGTAELDRLLMELEEAAR